MPTEKQVWDAADRVLAAGEGVSQKSVIENLRRWERGGSTRAVGPALVRWIAARNYKPRLAVDDLPERVQVELARFARDMWKEALVEAACRLDDERALVRAERIACDTLRDEAWVDARAAEAAAQVLRARNAEMAEEIGALQREIRRLKAAEFWDRVMREIAGILPERDGMTAEEIARVLHPSFGAEAIVHAQPLTPGRIKRKMAIRVEHRKYFEYDGKAGVFRRRAGPRRGRP